MSDTSIFENSSLPCDEAMTDAVCEFEKGTKMKRFFPISSLVLIMMGCGIVYYCLFFREYLYERQKIDAENNAKSPSENVRSLSPQYTAHYDYEDGGFRCTLYRFNDQVPGDDYYIQHDDLNVNYISSTQIRELLYFINNCPAIEDKNLSLKKQPRGGIAYFIPSSATKSVASPPSQ